MKKKQQQTMPIFVGGLMKSGTSLLRKLLGTHPDIFGGLETHWCSEDFKATWQRGEGTRQEWLLKFFEVDTETASKLRQEAISANDYFNRFMDYVTQRADKKRWVEKTPDNFRHVEEILTEWPNASVLILNRDPKDAYASWKKNNKHNLDHFMIDLREYLAVIDQYANHPGVLVVSYEGLVGNSRATLMKVCDFIGASYIDGLENYQGDDKDYKKVLEVTGKESPTTDSLRKPIFDSSIGQYKSILTEAEINRIEQAC